MNRADDRLPERRGSVLYAGAAYLTRVLARLTGGRFTPPTGGSLPPFPEMLRFVEAGGKLPDMPLAEQLALDPTFRAVTIEDVSIAGPNGATPARSYRPAGEARAGFVWIHGGAFIGGDLDSPEAHWLSLSLAAQGIAVLSLEYRKAIRGVHYPVPFEDCLAGWDWAVAHCVDTLGVAATELSLGGASAGGNLAAAVAKRVRDRGDGIRPKSIVLAYPWLHAQAVPWPPDEFAKARADAGGVFFELEDLTAMSHHYVGRRSLLSDPYAFPPNGDLSDLPPTLIVTAEYDSIRVSGEAFADALAVASGNVTLVMDHGVGHAIIATPRNPAARVSAQRISDWLLQG